MQSSERDWQNCNKRRTPDPWDKVDPRTPTPSNMGMRHTSLGASKMATMDPGNLSMPNWDSHQLQQLHN
eukprot:12938272-Prorocentrum_lima.AAC.1